MKSNHTNPSDIPSPLPSPDIAADLIQRMNWNCLTYPVSFQPEPLVVKIQKPDPSKAVFGTSYGFGSPSRGEEDDDEIDLGDDLGSSDESEDDPLNDQPIFVRRSERKIQRIGNDDGPITSVLALGVRFNWSQRIPQLPSAYQVTDSSLLITPSEKSLWAFFPDVKSTVPLTSALANLKTPKHVLNFKCFKFNEPQHRTSFDVNTTFFGVFNKTSLVVDPLHPFSRDPLVDYDVDEEDEWDEEKETFLAIDEMIQEQEDLKVKAKKEEAKRKRKEKARQQLDATKMTQPQATENKDEKEVDLEEDSSSSDEQAELDEYETDDDRSPPPPPSRTMQFTSVFGSALSDDSSEDDSDFSDGESGSGTSESENEMSPPGMVRDDSEDSDSDSGAPQPLRQKKTVHMKPETTARPQTDDKKPDVGALKRTFNKIIQDDDSDSEKKDVINQQTDPQRTPTKILPRPERPHGKLPVSPPKQESSEFLKSFLSLFDSDSKAAKAAQPRTAKEHSTDNAFSYSTKQFEKEGATQALRLLKSDTNRMRAKHDDFIDDTPETQEVGFIGSCLLLNRAKGGIETQMRVIGLSKLYDPEERQLKIVKRTRVPVQVKKEQSNSDGESQTNNIPLESIPLSPDIGQSSEWKFVVQQQPINVPVNDEEAHTFFSLVKTLAGYSIIPIPAQEQRKRDRTQKQQEREQKKKEREQEKLMRKQLREERGPKLILPSTEGFGLKFAYSIPLAPVNHLKAPTTPRSIVGIGQPRLQPSAMRTLKGEMLREFVRLADGATTVRSVFDAFEQKYPLYKYRLKRTVHEQYLNTLCFKGKQRKRYVRKAFRPIFGLDENFINEDEAPLEESMPELPAEIRDALNEEEPPIEPLEDVAKRKSDDEGEFSHFTSVPFMSRSGRTHFVPLKSLSGPELLHLQHKCLEIFGTIEKIIPQKYPQLLPTLKASESSGKQSLKPVGLALPLPVKNSNYDVRQLLPILRYVKKAALAAEAAAQEKKSQKKPPVIQSPKRAVQFDAVGPMENEGLDRIRKSRERNIRARRMEIKRMKALGEDASALERELEEELAQGNEECVITQKSPARPPVILAETGEQLIDSDDD
ncbi:hypothetical protein BLNAU_12988 [Blattamonas nauphoetae]|uniref:Chromatin assembly factor 1 subunit A dimerization domain-containing protein n=1 Tax=Blattamonas nauphoetae TaxID=2049346 RepID=A0ABQ9XNE8_9EUKA|nr:hypothetical protein BLNAU_12988 [Blattamonas nauphoetae]